MFALAVAAMLFFTAFLYWAAWVWPTLPFGFGAGLFGAIGFLMPLVSFAAVLGMVVAAVDVVSTRSRTESARLLAVSFAIVAGTALGIWLGPRHKMERIRHVANAAMPLVRAIEGFERDNHRPPASLTEIVPRYLPEIPPTGMRGYPAWDYVHGSDARSYGENAWILRLHTGGPGINFDQLIYFPNQRYPDVGHGGWIERVGAWGYVHE